MTLINLTPHEINLIDENSTECIYTIPSTNIARCEVKTRLYNNLKINGKEISIFETELSKVYDLPEKKPGVLYIVSRAVANKSDRKDLLIPNQIVRDHNGSILGCRSFAKVVK